MSPGFGDMGYLESFLSLAPVFGPLPKRSVILSSPTRAASYDRKMTLLGAIDSIEFVHRVIRSLSRGFAFSLLVLSLRKML